ncbi:hypothetical protein P5673_016277 [Acropora cervicornis]|uniref:Uncharacterized protein n=1 Tax=Acropora cervicornis TaxID=6130 RepID=A0AAD9V4P5_ACRCE|nr:hypothetical protein P5673_016277 [Acropora cervicornis]
MAARRMSCFLRMFVAAGKASLSPPLGSLLEQIFLCNCSCRAKAAWAEFQQGLIRVRARVVMFAYPRRREARSEHGPKFRWDKRR